MEIKNLPLEYRECFNILSRNLGDKLPAVTVIFEKSPLMTVGYDGEYGYIKCDRVNRFARLLGLFAQGYASEKFEIREQTGFESVGCMLDLSFGSALTVESIYSFFEYAALLGYNRIWLYMEDMYEIKERPHFGYLRGRYSYEELKAIDDYAYALGIEAVPCIQTFGHLKNYLCWPEALSLKDGPAILPMNLIADVDETYEFIEQMILNASAPFRSKKIHIGCDETAGIGRGKYLERFGYKDQLEIFVRHVNRVIEICKEHELSPMMWGDMFIAYSSKSGDCYDCEAIISERVKSAFSKDVGIVFWHYGQRPGCEEVLLDKYSELPQKTIFACGVRSWQAPLTDNYFSLKAIESSLAICKDKGIREVFLTLWTYVTSMYQTTYLAMCQFAELAYNGNVERLRERFEFLSGASYDAFMRMSDFNDVYDSAEKIKSASYQGSAQGNNYYISDILLNVLENDMINNPRSSYYRNTADFFRKYITGDGRWDFLYGFSLSLFDFLSIKSEIAEKLTPAYKGGKRDVLYEIKDVLLPRYLELLDDISAAHAYHKDTFLRPFGTENRDQAYGAMKERARTAIRRIGLYLDGRIDRIGELEDERLDYTGGPIVTIVPKIYY